MHRTTPRAALLLTTLTLGCFQASGGGTVVDDDVAADVDDAAAPDAAKDAAGDLAAPDAPPADAAPDVVPDAVTPDAAPPDVAPDVVTPDVAPADAAKDVPALDAPADVAPADAALDVSVDAAPDAVTPDAAPDVADVPADEGGLVCTSPRVACGGRCVDAQTDPAHCGGCGRACEAGQLCEGSVCVNPCASPRVRCDGACVDTSTSAAHCGRCGNACGATEDCVSGRCTSRCAAPRTQCGTECVTLATDPLHCGACSRACSMGQSCVGGLCRLVCPAGQTLCTDVCVDTSTSPAHCGRCGNVCPSGSSCMDGSCVSGAPTGATFQVPGLRADGCVSVEHGPVTGDDRGGIAASSSQVFYSGDLSTARFSTAGLGSPTAVGAIYDALFSDIAAQQVYAFGTAAGPYRQNFTNATVNFDRFFAINGATGAVGASTMLSRVIPYNDGSMGQSGGGYFSGAGRVVVLSLGRVYDVALPSGAVVDRGAFTFPAHAICESTGVWGVAEFFGGALYVDYVQSGTAIVRQQVSPTVGMPQTLAAFSNLSDMCAFTVSPTTNRWYWHHEGGSQFRTGDESIGYCNLGSSTGRTCRDLFASGTTTSGVYTIDPDGAGPVAPTQVYCDMTNDGGGWTLVGRLGDPRYFPQLDRNTTTTLTAPGGTGNALHAAFASITGTDVRVGRMVGRGTNTGALYQINDCTPGDAACWYARYIPQNDGDTFGAWLTAGGNWGFVPNGCTSDQCPTNNGDRDHSLVQRIAIFGGDCHSTCQTGGDDSRNGLTFRDYGTAAAPQRVGNQATWGAGTVTPGATALGPQISIVDYGQGGTQWRDLWIR